MARVAGKKAFITGGGQGLGACFGRMLAAEGAQVALTDINIASAEETVAAINADFPGKAIALKHDVTVAEDWDTALGSASEAMGGISIRINNAGIGSFGSIETESLENWRRVQEVDVDAIFVGTQKAMPYLKDAQPASIINISSIAGLYADRNFLAYNAAKAAVWLMTKSIALHCAHERYDVRCNSVHPVFTRTPILDPMLGADGDETKLTRQIPLRRLGEPEDIGHCIVYLASDESRFVTASEFKIDGGITAR